MCAPERVHEELRHVASNPLKAWAKNNQHLFIPHDVQVQQEAANIVNTFPGMIDPYAVHDEADRWIVALAKCKGFTVVTHETSARIKKNPPRPLYIPDICRALNVDCINLVELMRHENWLF